MEDAQQVCPPADRRSVCPTRALEVSSLYYDRQAAQAEPGGNIDLRFETIRQRLDLPR